MKGTVMKRTTTSRVLQQKLKQARALVQNGELEKAGVVFESIRTQFPEEPAALLGLGTVRLRQGDVAGAEDYLTQASSHEPTRANAVYLLARVAEQREQTPLAIDQYRRAIAANPRLARARLDLARALIRQGDLDAAADELREALRYNPQSTTSALLLARALEAKGDGDQALAALDDMLDRVPEAATLHGAKGRVCARLGQHAKAVDALGAAARLAPDDAHPRVMLAQALAQMDRPDQAIAAYREALSLDPQNHWAQVGLARLHLQRKQYDEARELLHKLSQGARALGPIHFMLGQVYAGQRHYDQALVEFQAGIMHTGEHVRSQIPELEALAASDHTPEDKVSEYLKLIEAIKTLTPEASVADERELMDEH